MNSVARGESCVHSDSEETSSEPRRHSLMPSTMLRSSPDEFDVDSPFSYHVSAAFLSICILFSLHSALAKLVGAKLSQRAVCLLALHLSSGCQLQFRSQLSFILHSCYTTSGMNWFSMILYFPHPSLFFSLTS